MTHEAAETLKNNGIAVIPSDTLYGIMGSARSPEVVEKIYELRGRDRAKPLIVLIKDPNDLAEFGVTPTEAEKEIIKRYWPGKVTIVFDVPSERFSYLHRGTNSLAFRVPDSEPLRTLLTETGPLVAPSANTEGSEPARTIEEAKNYFREDVGHYEDGGILEGLPSTLLRIKEGKAAILRQGAVTIDA